MKERNVITPPIKKNYFWNTPLTYKGKTYPANAEELVDENGNLVTKNVFADANGGRHFISDDGTLTDVYMNSGELPEVTVTAPMGKTGMRNKMADAYRLNVFNAKGPLGYLQFENTLQNNLLQRQAVMKAAGYNVPQNGYWNDGQEKIWNKLTTRDKEYDTTLLGFLQGMADKSNGNTTYTSNPFRQSEINQYNPSGESLAAKWKTLRSNNKVVNAIAGTWGPVAATSLAAPYAVEAADALAGTTAGQAISNGLNFATKSIGSNKAWPFLDAGITSYFGAEGINDIRNGKFTPETAVNLLPFLQMARPVAEGAIHSANSLENGFREAIGTAINSDFTLSNYFKGNKFFKQKLQGESPMPFNLKKEGAKRYSDFINSNDYAERLKRAGLEAHRDYMIDLTKQQIGNINYFPGSVATTIEHEPDIFGVSYSVSGPSPYNKVVVKKGLSPDDFKSTLNHEIAHYATNGADVSNTEPIGDIMRYNENIVPNIEWDDILKTYDPKTTSLADINDAYKKYLYLTDPQEKRARAYSILQQAKDEGLSTDAFVDSYTKNGKISEDTPYQLRQMGKILTIENLKKYLKNFLSTSAPLGLFPFSQGNYNTNR